MQYSSKFRVACLQPFPGNINEETSVLGVYIAPSGLTALRKRPSVPQENISVSIARPLYKRQEKDAMVCSLPDERFYLAAARAPLKAPHQGSLGSILVTPISGDL